MQNRYLNLIICATRFIFKLSCTAMPSRHIYFPDDLNADYSRNWHHTEMHQVPNQHSLFIEIEKFVNDMLWLLSHVALAILLYRDWATCKRSSSLFACRSLLFWEAYNRFILLTLLVDFASDKHLGDIIFSLEKSMQY